MPRLRRPVSDDAAMRAVRTLIRYAKEHDHKMPTKGARDIEVFVHNDGHTVVDTTCSEYDEVMKPLFDFNWKEKKNEEVAGN